MTKNLLKTAYFGSFYLFYCDNQPDSEESTFSLVSHYVGNRVPQSIPWDYITENSCLGQRQYALFLN